MLLLPVSWLVAPQVAPGYMLVRFSEFDFDHFRSKAKPLPVTTSGRILSCTADLVFDSLLCMFDSFFAVQLMFAQFDLFFARFDWCWCSWIYFYAFRFICMQFDSFLWGSIHLCTVRFIFVPVRFNFCAVRFIFSDVRFIFTWFVSPFVVLIFHDRFSFYLCAFHIVHFGLEEFVRNGAPYSCVLLQCTSGKYATFLICSLTVLS